MRNEKLIQDGANIITLIIAVIAIYFQINPPQTATDKQTSLILFSALLLIFTISYFFINIFKNIKANEQQIDMNTSELRKIKEQMKFDSKLNDLDKRISIFERIMNKRGELDPRVVLIAIMLVLLYLYLRSLGLLP